MRQSRVFSEAIYTLTKSKLHNMRNVVLVAGGYGGYLDEMYRTELWDFESGKTIWEFCKYILTSV